MKRSQLTLEELKAARAFADSLPPTPEVNTIKESLRLHLKAKSRELNGGSEGGQNRKRRPRRKGPGRQGRQSAEDFPKAPRVPVEHECLKAGELCPACQENRLKGRLYSVEAAPFLHWTGQLPLTVTVYELVQLRCSVCGKVYTAKPPAETRGHKFSESAKAMVSLFRYGFGIPFYRLERVQLLLQMRLPAATQWQIVSEEVGDVWPVYQALLRHVLHEGWKVAIDDTHFPILELLKENQENPARERTGMHVTAMRITDRAGRVIQLYLAGRNHAGENMDEVFGARDPSMPELIQISDALAANLDHSVAVLAAHCWAHALRRFLEVTSHFPEEAVEVVETIVLMYENEAIAKERGWTGHARMQFHQQHSGPAVDRLWLFMTLCLQRRVDPNSPCGKAMQYLQNHWTGFTLFLRVPHVELDNNLCEQAVKQVIAVRKNSLFFKTIRGALVGCVLMSVIQTCREIGINPFDYLVDIQANAVAVHQHPDDWLPWVWADRYAEDLRDTG